MITFRYEVQDGVYAFRFDPNRMNASVTYPNNGGSSLTPDRYVEDTKAFGDYVTATLGGRGEFSKEHVLTTFNFMFDRHINAGLTTFKLQQIIVEANCMTNLEQEAYRMAARQLDDELFETSRTHARFNLTEFEIAVVGRCKDVADEYLRKFKEQIALSRSSR